MMWLSFESCKIRLGLLSLLIVFTLSLSLHSMTFTDTHGDDDPTTGGGGWTVQTGTSSDWPEASSFIKPASNNVESQITNDNTFANDGVVTCSLTIHTTGTSGTNGCNTAGLLLRWTSSSAFYYIRFARLDAAGSSDQIYFHTNSIATAGGTTVATGLTTGNPFELKIAAVADSFTFFVNGSQVGQVVDATHSSGRVGYAKAATWDQQMAFYEVEWYDSTSNNAPTDIALSPSSINENQTSGTYIGTFTTTDADGGDSHTYTLVSGTGDGDNTSVTISNDTLFSNAVYDYESKSTYNFRVKTDDGNGGTYEEAMSISVSNVNDTATDISLSPASIYEGKASGTFIGTFTTTDQDAGDGHTYTFATGGTDNASFTISNDSLYSNAVYDYDVKNSYSIKVRTTDNGTGTLWYEKNFTITVLEVEDIDDWANSINIYINTTATGANVANNVYDFPLLVRLDPSNFSDFANTNANGEDIRFTKSNGSFLYFEKEFWKDGASDNDTAAFWVKIDTVFGNNSEQFIKMWWNKASESSVTNPENVFEISNNFAAVYHLDEEQAGTGTADVYTDATSNNNDADDYASATGQGAVAKEGQEFDGTDDYLSIPQSSSLDMTGNVTMSGWFKLDANFTSASSASEIILTKHKNNDNNMVITLVGTDYDQPLVSDGALAFKVECRDKYSGSYKFVWTNTTSWTAGSWYYFTVVIDYDNMANNKIYINGVDDTN